MVKKKKSVKNQALELTRSKFESDSNSYQLGDTGQVSIFLKLSVLIYKSLII